MKNVLFVGPNFRRRQGGIASVLAQYEEYLGADFNFYSSAYFRSTLLNFLFLPISLFIFFVVLLIHPGYKLIHIHGSFKGSFYRKYFFFLLAKKVFNRKVLYHIHGSEYHLFYQRSRPVVKKYISKMIREVDALLVLSEEWRTFFRENFDQDRIYIVNNIVAANVYVPKITEGETSMIFLGRIGERKGVFDLLEAIAGIQNECRGKVSFYIGGDGDTVKLKNSITEEGVADLVEFIGWVSGEQKRQLLQKSHVMILPSYNEGLPISLLEAMSYGMPLISTHVGGIPNILTDGENGFVVEPGNKNQIGRAIENYIDNPRLINLHGQKSFQLAESFFPENVFAQLIKIYSEII